MQTLQETVHRGFGLTSNWAVKDIWHPDTGSGVAGLEEVCHQCAIWDRQSNHQVGHTNRT